MSGGCRDLLVLFLRRRRRMIRKWKWRWELVQVGRRESYIGAVSNKEASEEGRERTRVLVEVVGLPSCS
jgi:hypothetical protein